MLPGRRSVEVYVVPFSISSLPDASFFGLYRMWTSISVKKKHTDLYKTRNKKISKSPITVCAANRSSIQMLNAYKKASDNHHHHQVQITVGCRQSCPWISRFWSCLSSRLVAGRQNKSIIAPLETVN